MNKTILKTAGLAALVSALSGCGEDFPQYSGEYERDSTSLTDPAFQGAKNWPQNLNVLHRMEYGGTGWDHYLRLEFIAENESEAQGNTAFNLASLAKWNRGLFPGVPLNGVNIFNENRIYAGAFCNMQVQYYLFAVLTPGQEILDRIYPSHTGEVFYDEVTGMPLQVGPNVGKEDEIEIDEDAAEEWFEAVDDNDGTAIDIYLSRRLDSEMSGCDWTDSGLLFDGRGNATSNAVYRSTSNDYSTDLRSAGLEGINDNVAWSMLFFEQLISGVKHE